jgi:hypothetical protein
MVLKDYLFPSVEERIEERSLIWTALEVFILEIILLSL